MEDRRRFVKKNSSLPYSFEYKIRREFEGKKCPICGCTMKIGFEDGIVTRNRIPTIQHNKPISKGGKHELCNISVICKQCNITIQDKCTKKLNSEEVSNVWQMLNDIIG